MNAIVTDLMAVIGVVLNGLPQDSGTGLWIRLCTSLHWHFL